LVEDEGIVDESRVVENAVETGVDGLKEAGGEQGV